MEMLFVLALAITFASLPYVPTPAWVCLGAALAYGVVYALIA
jgi:hypothetical protein